MQAKLSEVIESFGLNKPGYSRYLLRLTKLRNKKEKLLMTCLQDLERKKETSVHYFEHYKKGVLWQKLNKPGDAIISFSLAARTALEMKNYQKAGEFYFLAKMPAYGKACFLLGANDSLEKKDYYRAAILFWRGGMYQQARENLRKIKIRDLSPGKRGYIFKLLGLSQQAKEAFIEMGGRLVKKRKFQKAAKYFQEGEDMKNALTCYKKALLREKDPCKRAKLTETTGDIRKALYLYEKCLIKKEKENDLFGTILVLERMEKILVQLLS